MTLRICDVCEVFDIKFDCDYFKFYKIKRVILFHSYLLFPNFKCRRNALVGPCNHTLEREILRVSLWATLNLCLNRSFI